jgi:tetratricopeptide (TPR) repeat protein
MSTNSPKRRPKNKIWIPAVTSALILIVLVLGCYQKISDGGNPNFANQTDQRTTFSEKDLDKFGSSIKIIDGEAESHYKMALYFQRRKKHKFAIEELKEAIQLNPLFTKAYNAMGVSYDKLGNHSQAVGCYRSALKLDPRLDYVHNNLGYSYLLKNELDAAIVAFQKAIELNDNNKRYHNNLGLAYVMKDQYDKAYDQFRIVEGDSGAKEKLTKLLDKLGKEKSDHYFAKHSNSDPNREKSESKTPVVIKPKINDEGTKSLIKTDGSDQKPKDQEIKDEKFSLSNKKVFLNTDKDVPRFDETGISKGYSGDALAKNPEIADPKKVKSFESIEKRAHRELQTESEPSDEPFHSEFIEENTAESDLAAMDANPIKIITAESQNPSTLSEKPTAETKTEIKETKESSVSSDPTYYISTVELVPDPVSEKNISAESVKAKTSSYEDASRVQSTFEPKVIEVEEPYYQDGKETAPVTPAGSKEAKEDLIGSDKTVLEKKQPSVYAEVASTITSTDKKIDGKTIQGKRSQSNESLNLAAKKKDLKENSKSEDTNVEIEIEVANGNGVNGAATRFGTYLKSKGFKVAKVTNANSFDHASTKVFYYNGDKKNVYKFLKQIPFVLDQQSIIELKNLKNCIKIIIGKDQIKHDKIISKTIHRKRKF